MNPKKKFWEMLVFMLLLLFSFQTSASAVSSKPDAVPGDVIVLFKSAGTALDSTLGTAVEKSRVNAVAVKSGANVSTYYSSLSKTAGRSFALIHSDKKSETELLDELRKNPEVLGVSLNYRQYLSSQPNDPKYSQLWGMKAISADKLWDEGFTGGNDVYVAVIDSGVTYNHEDLAGNFESKGYSRNFTTSDPSYYIDKDGHGSHVSGTIAAVGNNGKGVAGVNWKAKIIALRVFNDDGDGYTNWTIDALNYLCELIDAHPEMKLAAVNLSLGCWASLSPSEMVSQNHPYWAAYKALSDKNKIVICVSAGNDSIEVGKQGTGTHAGMYKYPCSFLNISNMIVVGAADNNSSYSKSSFSNYSTTYVDVAAPGRGIVSTVLNNQYESYNGTSMAAPHVTGAAALLKSIFPEATPSQIKAAIKNGANTKYAKDYTANGLLNVKGAYNILNKSETLPISGTFKDGVLGTEYSASISVSDGTAPYTWTKTSGSFPDGLTLSSSGTKATLSGKPTKAGTFTFTLKVTDSKGKTGSKQFSITIASPSTSSLPITWTFRDGTVGASYSDWVSVSGGVEPYTWTKTSGSFPDGLTLSSSGTRATLSGTPTKAGTFVFTLQAKDKNGSTGSKSFTITIASASSSSLSISWTFKNGTAGASYSDWVSVSGGVEPYTWTKTSGSFPNGLTLSSSGTRATLSGTPTKAGTFNFTLQAKDTNSKTASKSFTITIAANPMTINYSFKNGTQSTKYSDWVSVSGGTAPYTWTKTSGTFPDGLTLSSSGSTATLLGTPSKAGKFTFALQAKDYNGITVSKSFTMTIAAKPLAIGSSFKNGVRGASYSAYVTASGGTSPYTWTKASGTLPTGLKLTYSGAKATLSGKPTKAGTYTFKLKVTDKNKTAVTKSFTVKVTQTTLSGTFTANGAVKKSYSSSITVSGGTTPYTWTKSSGTLPTGLKLTYSGAKATLSGTPTKAGTFTFTLKVSDKNKIAATKSFTVKITQPVFSGTFTANGAVKKSYSSSITVSGGTTPYTWAKSSGTLPTGLKLTYSGTKVTLSGTPTKTGTFTFKLKVTDKNKTAVTKSFTVKITQPTISGTLSNGAVKKSYSASVTVSGGTSAYTWTKSSGTLPTGLKLTYSGTKVTLSGTPTKAGTYKFTLKVTDKNKATATKTFTVSIITSKPEIPYDFIDGTVKVPYKDYVMAENGTEPYTWTKTSGTIPTGLKLTYSGGAAFLSGTPTKAGTFKFTLKVTDKNKAAVSKTFTVKIAAAKSSSEVKSDNNSSPEPETKTEQKQDTKSSPEDKSTLPEKQLQLPANGENVVTLSADLKVVSDDIVESYDGRDSDLVKVRADKSLRFTVSNWGAEISSAVVYIDDKPLNGITVSDEGLFILPAEIVSGDFKVGVKAQSEAGELESSELYIITE